jgi:hypothetical protein
MPRVVEPRGTGAALGLAARLPPPGRPLPGKAGERIHADPANPNLLHDEVTVIDHALTQPWTVDKRYVRNPGGLHHLWPEYNCPLTSQFVPVGMEMYYLSADGYLMPMKKGQKPPDLRYFRATEK